jgi:DNA-binding LytR/AlgR family response regulator
MRIAICDDNLTAGSIVMGAVKNFMATKGIHLFVDTVTSIPDLEEKMQSYAYDILLLDIQMSGTDGISFALKLREQDYEGDVIFVSSREDKVFEALRAHPFGFIRKSHFVEDVEEILELYLTKKQRPRLLNVKTRTGLCTVRIEEIVYLEGARHYQMLWRKDKDEPLEVTGGMDYFENELEKDGFLRVHKGYLVNFRHVQRIEKKEVLLATGVSLPMSRQKEKEIKEQYMKMCQEMRF